MVVAVGEIFLWNNHADREALELSKEGGGPLNNLKIGGGDVIPDSISHPIHLKL